MNREEATAMKNGQGWNRFVGIAAAALLIPLTACDLDRLLVIDDPDTVDERTVEDPSFIEVVIAGAYGDFVVAYSTGGGGLGNTFLPSTAAISDELFFTGTFAGWLATDSRSQFQPSDGNMADGAYVGLHRARRALWLAADKVARHERYGTSSPEYGELTGLWGYTYVALGEAFCSYIPVSNDEKHDPSDGPPRTSAQLFEESLAIFERGGEHNLARMGRARALLNLGRYQEAASAAAGVPTAYNYFLEHSENASANPFYENPQWSMSHNEGGNGTGMPFRGLGSDGEDPANADPRLPWFEDPRHLGSEFRWFRSLKYPNRGAPVVLASGIEARLIEAEAALASGGDWLGILNSLRADVGPLMAAQIENYAAAVPDPYLEPLIDPGDAAARVDLLFQERALWLWGTGHRLGDLRRLVNHYGRQPDDVYPSGAYHRSGEYGADVVFVVPFEEANNALYDIDQCVAKLQSASFN